MLDSNMQEPRGYSLIHRMTHWAIAITFLLLLFTIFLRLTWMNKVHVAGIIEAYLGTTDQALSQEQLIVLAKQIRQPMWKWHVYLGYILVGLLSFRFMLPLFGQMRFQNPFCPSLTLKVRLQKLTYLVFYACVVGSLITGLIIQFGPADLKGTMESLHKLGIYYLVVFIVLHLTGVLIAEFTDENGIISRMVSGARKED